MAATQTAGPSASDALPSRLIVIGASAGGLRALSVILGTLPADFPAPLLVVQHLSPVFPSKMAQILGSLTLLSVKEAEEGDCLKAGWVYVAPPNSHLLVTPRFTLSLTQSPKVHHCRPSVDVLFHSAAASGGSGVIGVVLTGGDGDGSAGIRAIKAAGGVTIAQDLPSSEQPSMPRNAAATGQVDYVLPLLNISAALDALVRLERLPPPAGPTLDDKERADAVALHAEALRVAEEVLRLQSGLISSYRQTLTADG